MRQFFKMMFASALGYILAAGIGWVIVMGLFISIASMSGSAKEKVEVKENSILAPNLSLPITEREDKNPFAEFNFMFEEYTPNALPSIIASLEHAAQNDNIKALYLDLTVIPAGRASLLSIRKAISQFRESGKPVYAYADFYTENTYYIASVADSIFMQPTGILEFNGELIEMMFLRGMFDKLEIEPRVIKHGRYKSAGETFTEKEMSPANRKQIREFMESIYTDYLQEIASSRGVDTAKLRQIADEFKIRTPEDAVALGFVDGLIYKDQMLDKLCAYTGVEEYDDLNTLGFGKYKRSLPQKKYRDDEIAVIYATGSIMMGEGDIETIGSDKLSKAIRDARLEDDIKAIVLRVNSPGGSALASDIILRELELAAAAKPVIVSMGDVAASGGYYISCKAHKIYAQPNTITGSIGVIGFIPGTEKFFENKLGITFDRVKTSPFADLGNPNRDMTKEEERIIRNSIDDIYVDFITHVAEGRDMDTAGVNELGGGRIWSGRDALENGLVDELGGLEDAIAFAAGQAGIDDYEIVELPKLDDPFERFFKELGGVKERMIMSEIGAENFKTYKRLKLLTEFDEPLMLLPFHLR